MNVLFPDSPVPEEEGKRVCVCREREREREGESEGEGDREREGERRGGKKDGENRQCRKRRVH